MAQKYYLRAGVEAASLWGVAGPAFYREPDELLIERFIEPGMLEQAPWIDKNATVAHGVKSLLLWRKKTGEMCSHEHLENLKAEWFRLFVGAGIPAAPPWRSYYVDKESLLFGVSTNEVKQAYRFGGFEFKSEQRIPEDHLGLMLVFLAEVRYKEIKAKKGGDTPKSLRLISFEKHFQDMFLNPWVKTWAQKVQQEASSEFYKGLADIILGSLDERLIELRAYDV